MQTHDQDQQFVPLNRLIPSPFNVRSDQPKKADVRSLAASMLATGARPLQNLVVHAIKRDRKTYYGVAAGRRRHAGLELLHEDGHISQDHPVPVRIVSDADALLASLAENKERKPMHVADEIVAFKKLLEDGKSISEIASAFGVSAAHVKRLLKLADVSPRFLEMFRRDEIDIDQMMALTVARDHETQEAVWDSLPPFDRGEYRLRAALTQNEVNATRDPIARFVGLSAYKKAGGAVRQDLFDESGVYLENAALLTQLAQGKLDKAAKRLKNEGHAWIETRVHFDSSERGRFSRASIVRRDPTPEEAAELERLNSLVNTDDSDYESDEYQKAVESLDALEDSLETIDPQCIGVSGAIVTIGSDAKIEIVRGLIRPEDKKKGEQTDAASQDAPGGSGTAVEPAAATGADLSDRLSRDLTSVFSARLRVGLAQHPAVALAVGVFRLHETLRRSGSSDCVHVDARDLHAFCPTDAARQCVPHRQFEETQKSLFQALSSHASLLPWLLERSVQELCDMLAVLFASTFDCTNGRSVIRDDIKAVARASGVDMRQCWEPSAEVFLKHIPRAQILEAIGEAIGVDKQAELSKLKTKAQIVAAAEPLLIEAKWLPTVLRT